MKKILVTLLLAFIAIAGVAQQSYNPTVNSGIMNPLPLDNGIGECQFTVGNLGDDPLDKLDQPMILIVSLSYGKPHNADPIAAISGTLANKFNWLYDADLKTFQGTQKSVILANELGTIKIAYVGFLGSDRNSPQNGFNVNIIPPTYTNGINVTGDDKTSSYTYGAANGVLPVKLAYYNGNVINCISSLNWKSVTEDNFSHYEVEYSKDGIIFNTVAKIIGKGTNAVYSTTHNSGQGKAYYRLKMVDMDGKISYTNIIALDVNCSKGAVLVYPNPAKNFINVNITEADNNQTSAKLFNSAGQIIINKTLQNGVTQLDISTMATGIYQLKLVNSNGIQNIKILKK